MRKIKWVFAAAILVYLLGFGINMMEVDAAQYAGMSREMMLSGNYLQVYEFGKDYLDKPPFLFWISALSMKIFGVNNFGYKFPSFLFALFSLFSTFKLCSLYYKKEVAVLSSVILASCQAFFLMTNDVRTDTILMSWVIFAIWQLALWHRTDKMIFFFLGCAGIAGGMLTKGPIALLIPAFAFGAHFILMRNFKVFFRWQYLLAVLVIAVFLLPMCIGLYQQFDLNPQKLVNGKTGVSGLRFFFWTQSFGRITGESVWNNGANIFFLFQNLLWGFLPWIFVFIAAFYVELKAIILKKGKISGSEEFICMGGFILGYLSLGSSKYQLPHYIYVTLPFMAIISAKFLYRLMFENEFPKLLKVFEKSHFVILSLLWVLLLALLLYSFKAPIWISTAAVFSFMLFVILFIKKKTPAYFLKMCLFGIIGINFFINLWVYPSLLQYQVGSNIGKWVAQEKLPVSKLFTYRDKRWHSLNFYANADIIYKDSVSELKSGDYIIMSKQHLADLPAVGLTWEILYETGSYRVSALKMSFMNPATRKDVVNPFVVIKIK